MIMGAFYLLPNELENSPYERSLIESFISKGFGSPLSRSCKNARLVYYPKTGIGRKQYWEDDAGNFLIICGSAWYERFSLEDSGKALLKDLNMGAIDNKSFRGTFCLIYFNAERNSVSFFHDPDGFYRFYADSTTGALSSSWYALARSGAGLRFNEEAILFNLIMGFTPGTTTWIKNIERVLSGQQMPGGLAYSRCTTGTKEYHFSSFREAVNQSTAALCETLSEIASDTNYLPTLGLSSGFDSRLVAAALASRKIENLTFFTFHKPGDRDPVIASAIAQALQIPLRKKETSRAAEGELQQNTYENAFRFFDGQAVVMAQYSKPDYTLDFRKELLGTDALHLSGVGGEIFRNYNHDHQQTISIENWMTTFLLGGLTFQDFLGSSKTGAVPEMMKNYVSLELGVKDHINFSQRKRFYGDLFLRDWHSVRNSVENQFSFYYSPFTDRQIRNISYATGRFHGYGGKFEGQMIASVSRHLSGLNSEYGYALGSYPMKVALANFLRSMIKLPAFQRVRNVSKKKVSFKLSPWEKNLLAIFPAMGLGINTEMFLSSSTRREPLLSTAYALNKLVKTDAV